MELAFRANSLEEYGRRTMVNGFPPQAPRVMSRGLAIANPIFILFNEAYNHTLLYIPHGRHERKTLPFSHGTAAQYLR